VLSLGQTWEVAVWEIERLGSCPLGKYPWKKAFGKVSNMFSEHIQ